jgi:tetratricopeptide (TPR) repeat protein
LKELLDLPILPEQVVQAYVGEAFNRLDTNAQKVMQALAVYNRPVTPAAVDYLLAPHIPAIDSAPILQRLANMHFARKESGRFYLHPVDREFAYGLLSEGDKVSFDSFEQVKLYRRLGLQPPPRDERTDFTQIGLTDRAAHYFVQIRKPRTHWKKLDDLNAQLVEYELRCQAGDYDTACSMLAEVDDDYLLLWGHYRLTIDLHEKISAKIKNLNLSMDNLNRLETAYKSVGDINKAIFYIERGLTIARDAKNRKNEGVFLGDMGNTYIVLGKIRGAINCCEQALIIVQEFGFKRDLPDILSNLGIAYAALDDAFKAIEYYQQALAIARELNTRRYEAYILENHGHAYLSLGENQKALAYYQQAVQIADEITFSTVQQNAHCGMARAYLFQNDFVNARATIETALQYDVPSNNHNASALHGIIALRQGDEVTARGVFVRAIGQADEILSKTAEYYEALDAKGLALCGLAIVGATNVGTTRRVARTQSAESAPTEIADAIETFRKARKIAPHAGVVKRVLRLFDELAKCDTEGILKEVRKVLEDS